MIGGTGAGSRFLKLGIRFLKKWSRPSAIDCARERLPERWAVAGGLALVGSVMEAIHGDICPRIVLPLCYVSLASCALIGMLYMRITRALGS